jgi:hypothetical protein
MPRADSKARRERGEQTESADDDVEEKRVRFGSELAIAA